MSKSELAGMQGKIRSESREEIKKEVKKVGDYIVGKKIGKGNFGKVRLARHIYTNQQVALKILVKDKMKDKNDLVRVSRELQILKKLRHPHIIQLYEIIETEKHLYIVTEYLSEGELFGLIVRNKRLSEEVSLRFYNEILSGMEYMHSMGVVHRDLKPENLLMDEKRRLKIADFGLSNTFGFPNESLKTACGSPCYAPPEMIRNLWYCPMKADIWSSGIILFAMLCGYLPFDDPDTAVLYNKILKGHFSFPSHVSIFCQKLISGILQLDPEKRWDSQRIRSELFMHGTQSSFLTKIEGIDTQGFYIPVDHKTVAKIARTHQDPKVKKLAEFIRANRHNALTTYYYLLLKEASWKNCPSRFDLNSDQFSFYLLEEKAKKPIQIPSETALRKTSETSLNKINTIRQPNKSNALMSFIWDTKDQESKGPFISMGTQGKRNHSEEKRPMALESPVDFFGTLQKQKLDPPFSEMEILEKLKERRKMKIKQRSEASIRVHTEAFAKKMSQENNAYSAEKGLKLKDFNSKFLDSSIMRGNQKSGQWKTFADVGKRENSEDQTIIYKSMRSSEKFFNIRKKSKDHSDSNHNLSTSKFKITKKPEFFAKSRNFETIKLNGLDVDFTIQSSILKTEATVRNKSDDSKIKLTRGNSPSFINIQKRLPFSQTRNAFRPKKDTPSAHGNFQMCPIGLFGEKFFKQEIADIVYKENKKNLRGREANETKGKKSQETKPRNLSNPEFSKQKSNVPKDPSKKKDIKIDIAEKSKKIFAFSEKYSLRNVEKYNMAHRNVKGLPRK